MSHNKVRRRLGAMQTETVGRFPDQVADSQAKKDSGLTAIGAEGGALLLLFSCGFSSFGWLSWLDYQLLGPEIFQLFPLAWRLGAGALCYDLPRKF